jgi:hypothetical protein
MVNNAVYITADLCVTQYDHQTQLNFMLSVALFILVLNVDMLSVAELNILMLNVVMLSVLLSIDILNAIMLNVISCVSLY